MTIEAVEGFDLFAANAACRTEIGRRWPGTNTSIDASGPQTEAGRYGGLAWSGISTNELLHTRTFTEDDEWVIGFAFSFANPALADELRIRWLLSGTTQLTLQVKSNTATQITLGFYRGVTQVGNDLVLTINTSITDWRYLEFRVKFSATVGEVEAWTDGVRDFLVTGLNTVDTGAGGCDSIDIRINTDGVTGWTLVDDMYIMSDGAGAVLGEQVVETLQPDADGTTSGMTPLTGSDHYAMVDEDQADDDTTYLEADDDDELELFDYPALSQIAGAIAAVEVETQAAVSSWGTRKMKAVVRTNSTNVKGDEETVDSTSYEVKRQLWDENPEATTPWTPASVNAAEFGAERSA